MINQQPLFKSSISTLGYGCYALSGAYGAKLEESEMISVLQYAYELGIRFYDTSSSYTNTEEVLGKAVKHFRNDITIASKVGLTDDNKTDLSKEFIKTSCESSLKKLETDYIDIYQVHFHDPNTPIAETIEALEALKKDGKIRFYGIGHLPIDKTEEYLKLGNISFVLAEMSPANTYRYKELHPLQTRYSFDIIAFSITGRGLLSGSINTSTKFANDDIRNIDPLFEKSKMISGIRISKKLKEIGDRYGKTSTQVAISWTIQNPGVIVGLTGPTTIKHLEENSLALNWSLDKENIEEIDCFIEKEEIELKKAICEDIQSILNSNLSSDIDQSYKDLIYIIEHCMENRLISYEDGVGKYREIMRAKNSNNSSQEKLNEIREELKLLVAFPNQ